MKCHPAPSPTTPAALRSSAGIAISSAGPWNLKTSPFTNRNGGISTTKIGANTPLATSRSKSSTHITTDNGDPACNLSPYHVSGDVLLSRHSERSEESLSPPSRQYQSSQRG